jgi:hypothetical protein
LDIFVAVDGDEIAVFIFVSNTETRGEKPRLCEESCSVSRNSHLLGQSTAQLTEGEVRIDDEDINVFTVVGLDLNVLLIARRGLGDTAPASCRDGRWGDVLLLSTTAHVSYRIIRAPL